MKLQNLVIIFLLIILPIMLVYTINYNGQVKTLKLQAQYDEALKNATYDAIRAFEENTQSDALSGNAESKRENIKASMNMYIKSLAASSGFSAYNENDIKDYIPAVVFGLYDGFYMYAPTINNDNNYEPMLKNFVYYSERITGTDIVIRYSLDNYVAVSGTIGGAYITKAGYLYTEDIQQPHKNEEELCENIIVEVEKSDAESTSTDLSGKTTVTKKFSYEYYLIPCVYKYKDGKKIYKRRENVSKLEIESNKLKWKPCDENTSKNIMKEASWYTYSDYKVIETSDTDTNTEDESVKKYYTNAVDFTKNWWNDKIGILNSDLIINDSNDPEDPNSVFSNHKKSIIKETIQKNLNTAIAAYANRQAIASKKFKIPIIAPEDWEKIYSNVSVITFLQGIDIGYTEYNSYSVQNSTNHNEYPNPNNIYFINGDNCSTAGTYHDIRCTNAGLTGYKSNEFNGIRIVTQPIQSYSTQETNITEELFENKTIYYYKHLALACYDCVNNIYGNQNTIYNYIRNKATDDIKKAYWTALARERYNTPKTTDNFN